MLLGSQSIDFGFNSSFERIGRVDCSIEELIGNSCYVDIMLGKYSDIDCRRCSNSKVVDCIASCSGASMTNCKAGCTGG